MSSQLPFAKFKSLIRTKFQTKFKKNYGKFGIDHSRKLKFKSCCLLQKLNALWLMVC